ncbi:MAG: hypothetical protein GY746_04170, partial [Gammaproteobacteria bacterium]|nr:hypothetical protein [Gammaproteobacteria bacterium]
NMAIGNSALYSNTSGNMNVANGRQALDGNTTGSYNTAIGYFADVKYDNLTNATAIGAHATVSQDNSMVLGGIDGENGASADTKVGIGTSAPTNKLDVNGSIRMRAGATVGFISVSDANGVMTWTDPATISTAGDDLGDHIATQNIKLSDQWLSNDGDNEGVYVNAGGNVGIGTYTPTTDLDVDGSIRMRAGSSYSGYVIRNTNAGLMAWENPAGLPISTATQTALDGKQSTITGAATTITSSDLTPSRAVISNGSGKVAVSAVTETELGYVSGVTSSIQSQLNNNVSSQWITTASDLYYNTGNVGIGISAPDAKFHVVGSIKMADGNQAAGRLLTSDANGVMTWNDPASILTATANIIADADNDTKIQIEETADDDIIRFDMAGTEFFRMDSGRLEVVNTGNSVFIGDGAGANDDFSDNFNVAIGDSALLNNITGYQNVAVGHAALHSNTWGRYNSANGYMALYSNTNGIFNVANGYQALLNNTYGNFNVANGSVALERNTYGTANVANGYQALYFNTTGNGNVANGAYALNSNTTGFDNVANGYLALSNNITGWGNVANGRSALYNNVTGSNNTAIGNKADVSTGDLTNATAIGAHAIVSQDSSLVLGNAANVGIGTSTPAAKLHVVGRTRIDGDRLEFANTGHSVFIGEGAGASDDFSDNDNVAIGYKALFNNTIGFENVANGYQTLMNNTTGDQNVANGYQALFTNTGDYNVANGASALYFNTTGWGNVANGASALYSNTIGNGNVANGRQALYNNTTGNVNVANGNWALRNNTTGFANVANGAEALYSNTTGIGNVANGNRALYSNTEGEFNVAYGYQTLMKNTTGSNNTAIGYNADVSAIGLTNATAIGANAYASQSNTIVLGSINGVNTATADTKVGIGTSAPAAKLHVVGRTRIDGDRLEFVNTGNSVFIGEGAGASDDFSDNNNVAIGYQALFTNTGDYNVANGASALYSNTTGILNVANGYQALYSNTTGGYNVANGPYSLYQNTEGNYNIANGVEALRDNTNGDKNVAIGVSALLDNITGSYNTAIGYNADVSASGLTNATAIGANAYVSQDNSMVLGSISGTNGATEDTKVGIGTSAPDAKLHVVGDVKIVDGTQGNGNVLTSDADGVASWLPLPPGDHLGNHTATTNLKMSGKWLSNDGGDEGVFVKDNGYVGVGLNDPSQKLEVGGNLRLRKSTGATLIGGPEIGFHLNNNQGNRYSSITTTMYTGLHNPPQYSAMHFRLATGTSGTGQTTIMTLKGDGKVGIGTTVPARPLHVVGTSYFNGTVGINTTSPATRLQVLGGGDAGLATHGFIVTGPISGANICIDDNEVMARNNGSGVNLYLNANGGNVILGPSSSSHKLYVWGSAGKSVGGDHWNSTSDKRIKEDIYSIGSGLERIMQLNPVSYKYNKDYRDANRIDEVRDYYGFIAQEFK